MKCYIACRQNCWNRVGGQRCWRWKEEETSWQNRTKVSVVCMLLRLVVNFHSAGLLTALWNVCGNSLVLWRGCVTSPLLFAVALDWVMRRAEETASGSALNHQFSLFPDHTFTPVLHQFMHAPTNTWSTFHLHSFLWNNELTEVTIHH